jgi:AraC-like DNA-binding protein
MDVVSQMLDSVRLTGGTFLRAELRAPFAVTAMNGIETCARFGRSYEHVIPYHLILRGPCFAGLPGATLAPVPVGTVLLFPRGDAHVLADAPGRAPVPINPLLPPRTIDGPINLQGGGSGDATLLICGYLACERRRWNPLLASLPAMMMIDVGDGPLATWMDSTLQYALTRSSGSSIAADAQLARLSELLFVEALRRYMESLPPGESGWLAGLKDRQVGAALVRMHSDPAARWSVESLASTVGLSRSAFAERFQGLVGMPPLEYLTRWRMQLAAGLLRSTERSLLSIALETGYQSDAALIRAFRREFGVTPARWRRGVGAATTQP